MNEDELADCIYWEAEQYIPFEIQDMSVDYQLSRSSARASP